MARQSSSQTSDTSHATTMSMSSLSSDWGDSDDSDWSDSSNVDLTEVPGGSIYYFRCQGAFYKVGMTKRDIEVRLKEHGRNPDPALRPRQLGLIKVLLCDDVRQAETSILRDKNTPEPEHGREYFRRDIGGVVDRVVAAVNSRKLGISYYELNAANKIVRVYK